MEAQKNARKYHIAVTIATGNLTNKGRKQFTDPNQWNPYLKCNRNLRQKISNCDIDEIIFLFFFRRRRLTYFFPRTENRRYIFR